MAELKWGYTVVISIDAEIAVDWYRIWSFGFVYVTNFAESCNDDGINGDNEACEDNVNSDDFDNKFHAVVLYSLCVHFSFY